MSSDLRRGLSILGLIVAAWTMIGIGAHATYGARVTADEPQYLLTAISLGRDGDLDIADELADEAYRPFHVVDLDPQTYPLDRAGRQISPHDPLLPVMIAPAMRVGGWVAAKATLAVLAAILAMVTAWTAVRRFGVRQGVALPVVGVFACTAPLATYATQIYPEIPAALAVMVAVAALTGPLDRRGRTLFVLSVIALPWLSIKYALVAATLFALGCWKLRRERRSLALVTGALAIAGALYLAAHRAIYGGWTAYATGDYFSETGELAVVGTQANYVGRSRRLVGLLIDDGFGIGAWMIGWLILPFALGILLRRRPPGWEVLVATLAAGWFTATFVALTMHGWWWPGRQLVVVLPLGVVAIALAVDASPPALSWAVALAAVLGVTTWLWTTIEAITRRHVLVVDFDETSNPWMRLWRLALPNGRDLTAADNVLTLGWAAVIVALFVAGFRRQPGPGPGPGPEPGLGLGHSSNPRVKSA
jgi:hypothetical protein